MENAMLGGLSAYYLLLSLVILAIISTSESAPIASDRQAMQYLAQFGYLEPLKNSSGTMIDKATWKNAVLDFQNFAGLNATGEVDEETTRLMSLPRCGVKDKLKKTSNSRPKRYVVQDSRWHTKELSYNISRYPNFLERGEVDKEVAKAFGVWSKYTDLSFTPKRTGNVDIDVRFERGDHSDGYPFDGPGGVLGHAFFPASGGDVHFDDMEQWSIRSHNGINLFQVAAHEFGHSMGLSHSDVETALMAPFYRGFDPEFQLDRDDIQGIQVLYGKKTTVAPTFASRTFPAPKIPGGAEGKLCLNSKIDTVFYDADGSIYIFKGDYYWKLIGDDVAAGYPRSISKSWPGLPGNIDAAFTYKNGKTFFFKGSKYWRYQNKKMDEGYPMDISGGFAGIPNDLDSALIWSGNGKIYFFKGSKFWMYDNTQKPPVKSIYPKPLSMWKGVPMNIDAALQYTKGSTYFFKDGTYYRFNNKPFSVDAIGACPLAVRL